MQKHEHTKAVSHADDRCLILGTDYTDFTDIFDGECNIPFRPSPSTDTSEADFHECNTM